MKKYYPKNGGANEDLVPLQGSIHLELPSISPASDPALVKDYFTRIITDLTSDETNQRRDARSRLSNYLSVLNNPSDIDILTDGLSEESYRTQLGIAVALNGLKNSIPLTDKIRSNLKDAASRLGDDTFQMNIQPLLE